jgi:hypothetical protein
MVLAVLSSLVAIAALLPVSGIEARANVRGWDTRYVLVDGPDARRVPLGVYESYEGDCRNGTQAQSPHDYPAFHARVYACEL